MPLTILYVQTLTWHNLVLIQAGLYSKAELGVIGSAAGLAYGLSKFVMAGMSDRSNPRVFLPFGLLLSGLCMTMMGLFPWATSGIAIMWVMIFLNGWFQGMGWPPCGRTMVHWWSKSERGTIVSIWNTAHNIGGMMPGAMVLLASAVFFSTHGIEAQAKDIWQQSLYYPGIAAMICAIPVYFVMRDTHNLVVYHQSKNGVMTTQMTITKNLRKRFKHKRNLRNLCIEKQIVMVHRDC